MVDAEKELRRKKVLDMHNSGSSPKDIMNVTGLSRSGVYKILDTLLPKGEIAPKEPIVKVKLSGQEERFTSFVGYERTNVNQYAHKETGEVVNIAFVKAKKAGEFGYFVKVSGVEKKSTASGNELNVAENQML
jgi:hypothetical protein